MHSPEDYETIVQIYEPEFIHHVGEAIRSNSVVVLKLDGFRSSKEIVWACLWYAMEKGVLVTVVPTVLKSPIPGLTPEPLEEKISLDF
jgi:hypothetical protein